MYEKVQTVLYCTTILLPPGVSTVLLPPGECIVLLPPGV